MLNLQQFMLYNFITIEGNIGAGKTTLANILAQKFNARLILEQFADNPFLPKFYKNPEQYAFPLEMFFMAERYKQLKEVLATKDLFKQITITDYLFTKCLLFAKNSLQSDEYNLYTKLFEIINPQIIQPELVIYLHSPVSKLQANIKKRNRPYEQNIADNYLFNIQEMYINYIKQHNIKALIFDCSNADFLNNPQHLKVITDALNKTYDDKAYYFNFPD
jgi:deoxyguanosine kinase